jgi:transcriptional regulator with XRE-family HTH domain
MTPSPAQLRAARAWLHWSRDQAAHEAGLNIITVARMERGERSVGWVSLESLVAMYQAHGFVFGANTLTLDRGPH